MKNAADAVQYYLDRLHLQSRPAAQVGLPTVDNIDMVDAAARSDNALPVSSRKKPGRPAKQPRKKKHDHLSASEGGGVGIRRRGRRKKP